MSAAKKIIKKQIDRLKKAINKVVNPDESKQQWVLQPYRNPGMQHPLKKN